MANVVSPFLNQEKAARYLGGLSTKTLERWRVTGEGPEFLKLGRRCFYTQSALDSWADSRKRRRTKAKPAA
jgi:helix-turn-helix protein